jgi:hypothetical protein
MTMNAEAISALVKSNDALQQQCDGADEDKLDQLMTAIHNISSEIGAKANDALEAVYIPATDAFKKETDEAKGFLDTLDKLKKAFGAIGTVASALDTVIKLITTYTL